ncbi:DUF4185 domain-containing protein [Streptomyces sp. TS71-3]|uniref:DUF4185 domain-containing protein n=1 Tax=Streptomyces sp. TS71-3 TaxID=2733862 RepID=UPI001B2EFB11|nr:DUF4185 domain-containing protein [Streptomyces sp. TS71-3]GHJ41655.1 hypothetical protein Sm713_72640 [Streptomyces sp. TS71-3]
MHSDDRNAPATHPRRDGMSRSAFLRATAGAALAGGLSLVSAPAARAAANGAEQAQALDVHKMMDLTGPGVTTRFAMEATDLGIPARCPDGSLLFVFGDTFQDARVGGNWWRSPVALRATADSMTNAVRWTGSIGGEQAQQLWYYEHDNPVFSTVLPSDVITIGGSMFLHVMVNSGLGNVVWTEIWRSDDSGATWYHTGAKFPPDLHGGMFQLFTWGLGNDGFVYVMSTGFQRDKSLILHRVRSERITDLSAYEPWGWRDNAWAWGNPPTPVLEGRFGELCLRPLDGKWILTFFNAGDYRIDGIIMDTPTSNLYTAHRETLLWGGAWGSEDDTHVAQLYGGYVIPGSTLNDLSLSVSQWNTSAGWPYRVMQFRIQGFGG